ncbi:MAG: 3-deoxy-manno-octulosonate cytidylyltransferase [Bacteroidetes bacterium]|nr:3-deoxy-manno-octulosonate cytidylyltransferase [Bacteroidota bacterium]
MNIAAIIPARYNSQRLPAKPLADILGKSMIQRVYERATLSEKISTIIVATDDERIQRVVESFDGNVMMTPSSLVSGTDRVAYVSAKIGAEIIVNIQGDEPLINPEVIDGSIDILLSSEEAQIGTAVKRITNNDELINPSVVKVILGEKHRALYFSRSVIPFIRDSENKTDWIKEHAFYKHFGIYVYRRGALLDFPKLKISSAEEAEKLEQLRFLANGYNISAYITTHDSIPVDTNDDLEKVRKIFSKL